MEPYLQRGEVLIIYETLHFQSRKNARNICDPASSNHHNSAMFHLKKKKIKWRLHLKIPKFDRNLKTYLSCHNFPPLSSVQIF